MANSIKLRRSAVSGRVPSTGTLDLGELAINTYDGDLFFKKDQTSTGGIDSIVSIATLDGTQTLTNKTLTDPTVDTLGASGEFVLVNGTQKLGSSDILTLENGKLKVNNDWFLPTTAGNLPKSYLSTDGSGNTQFETLELGDLTNVSTSGATSQQILIFNGSSWVVGDNDSVVASAIFAPQATSDLGLVTEATNLSSIENLGFVYETTVQIYDLGQLKLDGIVSLSNIDQSVKADYIGYAIIFGF